MITPFLINCYYATNNFCCCWCSPFTLSAFLWSQSIRQSNNQPCCAPQPLIRFSHFIHFSSPFMPWLKCALIILLLFSPLYLTFSGSSTKQSSHYDVIRAQLDVLAFGKVGQVANSCLPIDGGRNEGNQIQQAEKIREQSVHVWDEWSFDEGQRDGMCRHRMGSIWILGQERREKGVKCRSLWFEMTEPSDWDRQTPVRDLIWYHIPLYL